MCRFLAYKGEPILLEELVFKPKNSLIRQSFDARELEEPLNGDGFGIGWYVKDIVPTPAVFVSMTPAWSNRNLRSLAPRIKSTCIVAHVRAASVGDISESNCHPFAFGDYLCMHNGGIEGFDAIKRDLRRRLSDETYSWIKGQTDSEHFFALVFDILGKKQGQEHGFLDLVASVREAIVAVQEMKDKAGVKDETYLNTVITNGKFLVATRYCSDLKIEPLSLYYATGARYLCEDGVCRMVQDGADKNSALVVSERLTDLREDWHKIPDNHFVVIDEKQRAHIIPIAPPATQQKTA